MPFKEIEKLLDPILDLATCECTSLTDLKQNHKTIIANLYETETPILLRIHEHTLLLCDPKAYYDLENRRRWVLEGCKAVEELVSVGAISLPDERIRKLADLKTQIAATKRRLAELKRNTKAGEKNLLSMKAAADALAVELKERTT